MGGGRHSSSSNISGVARAQYSEIEAAGYSELNFDYGYDGALDDDGWAASSAEAWTEGLDIDAAVGLTGLGTSEIAIGHNHNNHGISAGALSAIALATARVPSSSSSSAISIAGGAISSDISATASSFSSTSLSAHASVFNPLARSFTPSQKVK